MSYLKTKRVQLGDNVTASNNFVLRQPDTADGTMRISNGIVGAETDLVTVTSAGNVGIGTSSPSGKLHVDGGASHVNLYLSNDSYSSYYYQNTGGSSGVTFPASQAYIWDTGGTERMRISSDGYVTMPYQPAFLAHGNNSNYIPISGVGAGSYVPFANAVTNIGNHYNSSTYKFTAPVAGMYHFHSAVYTRTGTITEDIYTRWRVNNSSNKGYAYFYNLTGSEIHHTLTDSIDIYLNASDDIGVTINGSGTADFYTGFEECRFGGYLIG